MRRRAIIEQEIPICKTLPILYDKWLVDAVNGIDVANGRIVVQRRRSGFGARLWDGITGKSAAREAEINARLADAVDGSLLWLGELTESMTCTNLALTRVNHAVCKLSDDVARIADVAADTRERLHEFIKAVQVDALALEARLERVEAKSEARGHIDHVFSKWKADEDYARLALAQRCYAALEELRWGPLGTFCRAVPKEGREMMDRVRNEATAQLRDDGALRTPQTRVPTEAWLERPGGPLPDAPEALAYLGEDHVGAPFVEAVTRVQAGAPLPQAVPLISSPARVAAALVDEVLGGGA